MKKNSMNTICFLEKIKSKYGLEGIRKIYKVLNEEFAEIFRLVSYMSEVDYEQLWNWKI